ncbi:MULTISPECIES: DUF1523 family protein [Flammeovirga]|uniref:DUF1523 family protein n=1 Tax=Flammeovirga agarivorans TaxID=2726742 RepID=A0A7X8SPS3_9BACT|nr:MULTISPECIES: DUF1523 family protein [Flammeovirga]NLR94119.1 DUF1523 family protein [Flammeovirga agarivorans]
MKKYLYIGIAVIGLLFLIWIFPKVNRRTITATVTKTERSIGNLDQNKDRLGKYLVYTMDDKGKAHVFENVDTWLWFKFNSSDVYAKIQSNKKYNFSVVGFRIPIFSMYPNIITIEEVSGLPNN